MCNNRVRIRDVLYIPMQKALFSWINDQFSNLIAINGHMVISTATQILEAMNSDLSYERRVKIQFSKGWLHLFQKRPKLRSLKSYVESGDVDRAVVRTSLVALQLEIHGYSSDDQFNEEGFGLFYQIAPERTISESWLSSCKKEKTRVTFLACSHSTGSDRLPLLIIGHVKRRRYFKKAELAKGLGSIIVRTRKHGWLLHCFSNDLKSFQSLLERHLVARLYCCLTMQAVKAL